MAARSRIGRILRLCRQPSAIWGFGQFWATTDTTQTPEVNHLTISVDVPDTDICLTATVAAGGVTINYGQTFYTIPVVNPTAIGENLHAQVIAKTTSSVTLKVKDSSNNDVGGTVDLQIRGY